MNSLKSCLKNNIYKIVLLILVIFCCIGVYKYTTFNLNKSQKRIVCTECEAWEEAHKDPNRMCASVMTKCSNCGKERPCS